MANNHYEQFKAKKIILTLRNLKNELTGVHLTKEESKSIHDEIRCLSIRVNFATLATSLTRAQRIEMSGDSYIDPVWDNVLNELEGK